jgi:DNA-binding NtrC family response regulator
MKRRIAIVDDDIVFTRNLTTHLDSKGYEVHGFRLWKEALSFLEKQSVDLLLFETIMPGLNGPRFLKQVRELRPALRVIAVSASANVDLAVSLMKAGALDYIRKPVSLDAIMEAIKRLQQDWEAEESFRREGRAEGFDKTAIIGECSQMRMIMEIVKKVANTPVAVLITGESGTGKELIAKSIHFHSDRATNRFVAVDCGALTESLLESELFGHKKGAFTGATADVKGIFEEADKGTVFLDEIGTISPKLQMKLLRILQDGEFKRVGSAKTIHVDIRILAATNRDPKEAVQKGEFREDLYYRLNGIPIHLPPLRERGNDILLLMSHFLKESARDLGKEPPEPSDEFVRALLRYPWPGNIRELKNVVHKAVIFCEGQRVTEKHVPEEILQFRTSSAEIYEKPYHEAKDAAMEIFIREYLKRLLKKHNGVIKKAADESGIKRQTLHRLLKKYNLSRHS